MKLDLDALEREFENDPDLWSDTLTLIRQHRAALKVVDAVRQNVHRGTDAFTGKLVWYDEDPAVLGPALAAFDAATEESGGG